MGVCCFCCSIKETELVAQPSYYYYPREQEEHVPLSSNPGVASSFSGRLLVDTNLETSSPDTYRSPPPPIPFNVTLGATQTPLVAQIIHGDKNNTSVSAPDSDSIQEPITVDNREISAKLEEVKESESKTQTNLEPNSTKDLDIELAKLGERISLAEEDDDCPICLEEYDAENPKLTTECDHHFHLACILEWTERSETCPICDEVMVLNIE